MTTFETRLTLLFRDISYKDWTFFIGQDGIGLHYLQVKFNAFDAQSASHQTWGGRKWRLTAEMGDSEIVQTAFKAVLAAEEHEAREGFRYRGRAIYIPHYNVEKLWNLCGEPDALDMGQVP